MTGSVRVFWKDDLVPADPTSGMFQRAFEVPILWAGQWRRHRARFLDAGARRRRCPRGERRRAVGVPVS